MSFKVQSKHFSNMDDLVGACSLKTDKTRHTIAIGGTETVKDLRFVIDKCEIRYKPIKFDKLAVVIPPEAENELIKLWRKVLGGTEPFVKDSVFSLKLTQDQQTVINSDYAVGDFCTILVKFDAVWTINEKNYASFRLEGIKKTVKPPVFVEDW